MVGIVLCQRRLCPLLLWQDWKHGFGQFRQQSWERLWWFFINTSGISADGAKSKDNISSTSSGHKTVANFKSKLEETSYQLYKENLEQCSNAGVEERNLEGLK